MHKLMTPMLGVILVFAGIAGTADAANFTDSSIGISIDLDDKLSKQPRVRDIQYFNSEDRTGSLMIKQIHDLSIVDFLGELSAIGYRNRRDGIDLGMIGEPMEADIESGRGLLMQVRGQVRGQPIIGAVGAFSGHDGQGFLVIGSAKPEHWESWSPRMQAMFESIRFVEIDREALVKDWEKRLLGKTLQPKAANAGFAAQLEIHLCSDGAVTRNPALVGLATGQNQPGSGVGMPQSRNPWRITVIDGAPYLVVSEARERELMLEDEGENFLLNGLPYTITASELCQ